MTTAQVNTTTEKFVRDIIDTVVPDIRERVKLAVLAILSAQEAAMSMAKTSRSEAKLNADGSVRKPRGMAALSPERKAVAIAKAAATRAAKKKAA